MSAVTGRSLEVCTAEVGGLIDVRIDACRVLGLRSCCVESASTSLYTTSRLPPDSEVRLRFKEEQSSKGEELDRLNGLTDGASIILVQSK